ncbi:MAG TPA: Holliday junction resolvase-like protein [Candidatus Pacearchaeota archaeon]|nr:Holliday junction resolvase-like protein [Candidatus Pacearchaeota archaeon]
MEFAIIIFLLILLVAIVISYFVGKKIGGFKRDVYWEKELPIQRKQAIIQSRAVIGGQFSEQLAPYLPGFNYPPTECKFLGKPIDFLIFKGMDNKQIEEVIFVEVKSGKSKISPQEKNLRNVIENKRVRWIEYRIPEDLTKKEEF